MSVVVVVVVGFNTNFQHKVGFTWWPILMLEEEPGKTTERTTDSREATGKVSQMPTLAESET
jgi:hypothetical protein